MVEYARFHKYLHVAVFTNIIAVFLLLYTGLTQMLNYTEEIENTWLRSGERGG